MAQDQDATSKSVYSLTGLIKGAIVGLAVSLLLGYDDDRVKFEWNHGLAIVLTAVFGLYGLLWGNRFVNGFFSFVGWLTGKKKGGSSGT